MQKNLFITAVSNGFVVEKNYRNNDPRLGVIADTVEDTLVFNKIEDLEKFQREFFGKVEIEQPKTK